MSGVEGTRNGIDEQEGNAKAEKVTALNREPVTTAVLVPLELNDSVERFPNGTWMSGRDGERILAVHE
jgi:hypothetical protein